MAAHKIAFWNLNGARISTGTTENKLTFFEKEITRKFAIACLVESHHRNEDDFPEEITQYSVTHHILHTPASPGDAFAGVIVLVSKAFDIVDQSVIIPGRLLNFKVKCVDTKTEFNFSAFYGFQWARQNSEESEYYLKLLAECNDRNENNVILGDFNFPDSPLDMGKGEKLTNKRVSDLWQELSSEKTLLDPFRTQNPKKRYYSYEGGRGRSRGDRAYVNDDNVTKICNFKYIRTPFNSTHKIMTFEIKENYEYGPSTWKLNSSILKDQAFVREIEEAYERIQQMNIRDPRDKFDLFDLVRRNEAIKYSTRKANVRRALKANVLRQISVLENEQTLSDRQKNDLNTLKMRYQEIEENEIEGHKIRTRGMPTYEINEPNIQFYQKLEQRSAHRTIVTELQDDEGNLHSRKNKLLEITTKFYKELYTACFVYRQKQQKLFSNVDRKLTARQRLTLDGPITDEELQDAVFQMLNGKSPGLDGITIEFYKRFWYLIKDDFLEYINAVQLHGFLSKRNTSLTTIIYKFKGETYKLGNYRPISLINVDIKILSKVLANRLKTVLPSIIHASQTAIDIRKIDYTVHLLRDLIDLVNTEDSEAAFIFLDQEKAFDRVDHQFLYDTMKAFGIGEVFISWIRTIYANASTRIRVNGFLTEPIPLHRGVRQGCPLSNLLYLMVIEILALQFRKNPDIVGFQINGEKIVSLHYADDAIISILQNRCFKEVYKELQDYEMASGAKINLEKTKGLWVGGWKNRIDTPWGIEWTNTNVKTLGVYFGNDKPGEKTFEDIIPKLQRSINYWKPFALSKFSKARVIEIFHASRLWYALRFYDMPDYMLKPVQDIFFKYFNFGRKKITIAQHEAQKLREHGGAKLVSIETKRQTFRVQWLMDLTTNADLTVHKNIFTLLLGTHKGQLEGTDFIFTTNSYITYILKTEHSFYHNALKNITKLKPKKRIENINNEKLFYNPCLTNINEKVLPQNDACVNKGIFTYGQLQREYNRNFQRNRRILFTLNSYKQINKSNDDNKKIERLFKSIVNISQNRDNYEMYLTRQDKYVTFGMLSHRDIYEEILRLKYEDHPYKKAWEDKFLTFLDWDKIWKSVLNKMTTEETKSCIWEQIHIYHYTTYQYNKQKNTQAICPLCTEVPETKFHITLECQIVKQLWNDLQPNLLKLVPAPVSESEMAFGLQCATPAALLRNWLTFLLRECIMDQEDAAFHNKKGKRNIEYIKKNYNAKVKNEIRKKLYIYRNLELEEKFVNFFSVNDHIMVRENDDWQILSLYPNTET